MYMEQRNRHDDEKQYRDRAIPEAAADLVQPIDWQLFVTLEFTWNVRAETADRKFKALIDQLEREMRTRICYVVGKESRTKSGAAVPWHFHCCLTALKPIAASQIESIWRRLVHRSKATENDGVVDIRTYDPALPGVEYVTKLMSTLDAEWDFNWLHLFNPTMQITPKFDHRALRGGRRWQRQLADLERKTQPPFAMSSL
jgi:hypothetical protein